MSRSRMRAVAAAGAVAIVGMVTAGTGSVGAQVSASQAEYGGYATGTVIHADAIQTPDVRVVDAEVAFSGASTNSQGLAQQVVNEVGRLVNPANGDAMSYGRGTGLELGGGHDPHSTENQLILAGMAEASAPPSTDLVTEEIGPVPAEPLAYASVARGQAQAHWEPASCVLGADLAFGLGFVADVQILDTDGEADDDPTLDAPLVATDATDPDRAVSQSTSRTRLVPQVDRDGNVEGDALGVMSETRMTIAPVTIGRGQGGVTLEFLGEWVLRAVATGQSGYVHYGPGEVSPETPILRIIQEGEAAQTIIKFQDLFGDDAFPVPLLEIEPLGIEIAIGEDPRAIGGAVGSATTETATEASAAVDVVRVRILAGGPLAEAFGLDHAVDLRIGHMEVKAQVPAGGITCEIPVTKTSDKDTVQADEDFNYTITVENPFQCTLTSVRLVDEVSADPGVTFSIEGASDGGQVSGGNTITWDDIGPIEPGESKSVTVAMRAGQDSAAGRIIDVATATAACDLTSADGETSVKVPVQGQARIEVPRVTPVAVEAEEADRGPTPRTGGALAGLAALGLIGTAAVVRRFTR